MKMYSVVYQLLNENDCVIIPGFGGFVANYFEAKIVFKNQEFFPPSRKIAFNQSLTNNDGLLVNSISRGNQISWDEANKNVESFVLEITSLLKTNQKLEFGKLGSFSTKSGNLVFTPNAELNLLENSFGLQSFNFPMLKSAKEAIEIQKVKQLSKTKSATLNKPKKSRKSLVYIMSAAAVVGGMVFLSIYFDLFTNEKSNLQTANIAPVETVINTDSGDKVVKSNDVVEVTENQTNNTSIETTNNTEVKVIEPEVIKLTPPITSNFKVHVIAGSFSNLTNAENMQSEFQKSGFTSSILPISNGMYRVSVKSFADENQAIQEIEKLRTDTGNSALWVLCL